MTFSLRARAILLSLKNLLVLINTKFALEIMLLPILT